MRLIDADALPYENQVLSLDEEWCLKVNDIEAAPTIEQPQWISCDERLPTKEDGNADGFVLAYGGGCFGIYLWKTVRQFNKDLPYWMPINMLPQPPKGNK